MVEARDLEHGGRVEAGGITMGDAHRTAQSGALDRRYRRGQHLRRDIEPEQRRTGVTPGGANEIAAGAAADFQHAGAGCGPQSVDQLITAEQVIAPRQVVDVALPAVHLVHAAGGFRRPRRFRAFVGIEHGQHGSPLRAGGSVLHSTVTRRACDSASLSAVRGACCCRKTAVCA